LSVPLGGGAPFCVSNLEFACCWADTWRFSTEFPRRSTCCEEAEDGGKVVATMDCVNELLPLSLLLLLSVFGLPGSTDALENEGNKILCRENNKRFHVLQNSFALTALLFTSTPFCNHHHHHHHHHLDSKLLTVKLMENT
jgi:hypothetical protein